MAFAGDNIDDVVEKVGEIVAEGGTLEMLLSDAVDKTLRLINDPLLRQRIGKQEYNLLINKYDWNKMTETMNYVCREIACGNAITDAKIAAYYLKRPMSSTVTNAAPAQGILSANRVL